jgi:hypothetical protein
MLFPDLQSLNGLTMVLRGDQAYISAGSLAAVGRLECKLIRAKFVKSD